jgi:hypothetical protein
MATGRTFVIQVITQMHGVSSGSALVCALATIYQWVNQSSTKLYVPAKTRVGWLTSAVLSNPRARLPENMGFIMVGAWCVKSTITLLINTH